MATVAQIISFVEKIYPRANDVVEADQITFLNQVLDETYNKMLRVNQNYAYSDTDTVADQPNYSLPSDCTADNVIKIMVSKDLTVDIDSATEWDEYEYIGVLDDFDLSSGQYYSTQGGSIYIFSNGLPPTTSGYNIRIYYYATPSTLTATTDTPEINSKFHNLLKYGLISLVASMGDNPETEIADFWQRKYDEELITAQNSMSDKFNKAPLQSQQAVEYW